LPELVPIAPLPPERFDGVLTRPQAADFERAVVDGRARFDGRVIWNVNSTAAGGGVAEMLWSLIAYARGAGVDARWAVVDGEPRFFRVTKRLHNRLHGAPGDGGPLGERERSCYESVTQANAAALSELIDPADIVLLHDPQTAGLIEPLRATGARVVWRCHVGIDTPNRLARSAWAFLFPYVDKADAYVFSRDTFAWRDLDPSRLAIIPPSIDAFSPKNQEMPRGATTAILHAAGLLSHNGAGAPVFTRLDGSPGRIDRRATVVEHEPLSADIPIITQVSRWDRLKDPTGVIDGFARYVAPRTGAHLVLAGPDVRAVADDPEGQEVLEACIAARSDMPERVRNRVHLVTLPMDDPEENAAIVNALQRHSTIVVQKSIAEGFGLTVAEAMWKGRPVVASRIGGIQDQIIDGRSGLLVDPLDLEAFGAALIHLLSDRRRAARIGAAAHRRVRDRFLGPRHLGQYLELLSDLAAAPSHRGKTRNGHAANCGRQTSPNPSASGHVSEPNL
jgi:trehalose synthase